MCSLKMPNKPQIISAIKNRNDSIVKEHLLYASFSSEKYSKDFLLFYLDILIEFCQSQDNEHIEYLISLNFDEGVALYFCQEILTNSFNPNNKDIRNYIIKNKPHLSLDFGNYHLFVLAIENKDLELAQLIYKKHKFYRLHLENYNYIAVMESIDYAYNHFLETDYYILDWLWSEFKYVIRSQNKKFFDRYSNALKLKEF